jgi:acetyl-CoA carboxylase biotin carboxylase subunit
MFKKVAIANRGAVAARLVKTLRGMGIASVVLCSEADQGLPYVGQADQSVVIGPPQPKDSYLNYDAVIGAAKSTGAEALHPGWGFLSEDPVFAQKVIDSGLVFIGPSPRFLEIMGDKVSARCVMAGQGLPISPSSGELTGTLEEQALEAGKIGFPLMIKPAGGGGGIGMIPVESIEKLIKALETAESQARRGFGRSALYAEKLIRNPRHIEFQVVADKHGQAVHLWERDCSVQRRHQKILEEAGAPGLPRENLAEMAGKAAGALAHLGYDHLGTVETLYDRDYGFNFLEVNPRLQVEHAVTEEVTGVDLVATQIQLAAGEKVDQIMTQPEVGPKGHSLEARIYAEDPLRFLPSPGKLSVFRVPKEQPGLRVVTGYAEGAAVTPFYDPMIAQVIVTSGDRTSTLKAMEGILAEFEIGGLKTNIPFLRLMMDFEPYVAGELHTGLAEMLIGSEGYKNRVGSL